MKTGKRLIAFVMTMLMVLSCWVWVEPVETANAANITGDSNYLFAYFTGTSIEGQTIHLAVSKDGLNYTALRNNEPVIIPSKGTGCVRDPYLWYNEQDNYYYILATDLDFTDTGSDYSDNSESFIVWRSKDLVHWYDETMIDVKAVLGKLGINNNNMQAVWAPQVLWDGTSFVVYFSLQCDATSNGSWNPLTIVYIKTTDLLDQSAYYEYGVIHNPGRHVIDADIIKNPTTGQYYMFYKDEAASGGVQSIYYMISDSSPIGPYYAPGNANSGRGPQLFSWVGKNLEGCNSFFNDQGELVTYVDEYDYTNSSGQKEAHFHVSKTSDFTNYTKVDEGSYNINSLSPRHGSVVKITDEEYNRLLNNAYGITSSSFSATEELSDHLVGRYFTTSDYTYNAANGQKDLSLTDGTISMAKDSNGEYYANFASAGAQVNLANLIAGDLNIKDGFTITFTATVPTSLGSNARFFDISNNWSQRTNPAECYLHMSPVADSNGLYVGAYNGPVTTGSWTWASQGKNYNDGKQHDYIISFADGNMIMYIDGVLAMKRDRFNMNAEYGDNFLDNNWYKEIGNSVMRIGKSEWSDPLFTGYLQDFCIYDCSMSYYDVKNIQNEQEIEEGIISNSPSNFALTSAVPTFANSNASDMESLRGTHFNNIIYTTPVTNTHSGTKENPTDSGYFASGSGSYSDTHVGVYYASNTVLLYDGINEIKMPVMMAGRINTNDYTSSILKAYPVKSYNSAEDHTDFYLTDKWAGYSDRDNYKLLLTGDQFAGHNSSEDSYSAELQKGDSQGARSIRYYSSTLMLKNNSINFGGAKYKKYVLDWMFYVTKADGDGCDPAESSIPITASNSAIYVVDLRDYINVRNAIVSEYNSIVTNSSYCPSVIALYKSVVDSYMSFNPQSFNYAGGVEAAINNCTAQAQKLVDDYNKVKAQLGACKKIDIPGTSATCTAPGMTAGSYCEYCGEFYSEQKVTSEALGHNFVEVDVTKVQCTRCGEISYNYPMEIRYENLFSFNAWAKAPNNSIGWSETSTTISANMVEGSITIFNGRESGEVYSNASGTTRNTALYAMPVEGGKTYVYEFTVTGSYAGEVFIFKYDANGNVTGGYGDTNVSGIGTVSREFTVESNTAYVEFRFDANAPGTITYSDIGLYTKESFDKFAKNNKDSRLAYYTGENKKLCTPERDGYEFLGWSTEKNATSATYTPDQSASAIATSGSIVLYAVWAERKYTVKFDANGGSGSIADKTVKYADSFNLPADGFTREGYTFLGWSANKNATYATYVPGASVSKLTETTGATITLYAVWAENVVEANNDTVVIEYGLPVEINVLKNDTNAANVTAIGTSAPNTGSVKNTTRAFTGTSLSFASGNVTLENGVITYTPTTTDASAQEFYYEVTAYGNYYYAKVTVIPATSIYYEETFFGYQNAQINGNDYNWQNDGSVAFDVVQNGDTIGELNNAYGYDAAYDNCTTYSGNNVSYVTVDENVNSTNGPVATFTFTGTGFDLFTVTDYESGMVTATIYDSNGARVKGILANAYFGYTYLDGEYHPNDNGALYQVPIIKARDLDYGTYTVEIRPRYNKSFDFASRGYCKVYVDAVRIYDPMGANNEIANDAYKADGEYKPQYLNLRDTFSSAPVDKVFGKDCSVYIDGNGSVTIEEYWSSGPKNEVYLAKGDAIAFNIVVESSRVFPATIQLGMRITGKGGTSADVKLLNADDNANAWKQEITLNSATERFYSIQPVVDWIVTDSGKLMTSSPIVITNTSDAIISLTSLKWAFNEDYDAEPVMYVMTDENTPRMAMFAIRRAVQTEAQQTILNPENITFGFSTDAYTVGDAGMLTVVTEQGVAAVTVNGEDAIGNGVDENDKMIWTYEFFADEAGTMEFEIVAADENGFTSESVYASINVKDVVEETPETPEETPEIPEETPVVPDDGVVDDTTDDSANSSESKKPFAFLSDFIKNIINILKTILTILMGGKTA